MAENLERPLSVVMYCGTWDAATETALDRLLAQTEPIERREILLADDMARDTLRRMAARHGVTYLPFTMRGWSYAMNRCLQHARGDVVALTDDRCMTAPDWLQTMRRLLPENCLAATGKVRCLPAPPAWGWAAQMREPRPLAANLVLRRLPVLDCGGFDERLSANASCARLLARRAVATLDVEVEHAAVPLGSLQPILDLEPVLQDWSCGERAAPARLLRQVAQQPFSDFWVQGYLHRPRSVIGFLARWLIAAGFAVYGMGLRPLWLRASAARHGRMTKTP